MHEFIYFNGNVMLLVQFSIRLSLTCLNQFQFQQMYCCVYFLMWVTITSKQNLQSFQIFISNKSIWLCEVTEIKTILNPSESLNLILCKCTTANWFGQIFSCLVSKLFAQYLLLFSFDFLNVNSAIIFFMSSENSIYQTFFL